MPDEINRKGLARSLKLSARVGDKRIVRAIRRFLRKSEGYGGTFILPRDLDLRGSLDALERRLDAEDRLLEEVGRLYDAEIAGAQARYEAREREIWNRIWALRLTLHCAYRPDRPPLTPEEIARLPGVRIVSSRKAAASRSDDPPV